MGLLRVQAKVGWVVCPHALSGWAELPHGRPRRTVARCVRQPGHTDPHRDTDGQEWPL